MDTNADRIDMWRGWRGANQPRGEERKESVDDAAQADSWAMRTQTLSSPIREIWSINMIYVLFILSMLYICVVRIDTRVEPGSIPSEKFFFPSGPLFVILGPRNPHIYSLLPRRAQRQPLSYHYDYMLNNE